MNIRKHPFLCVLCAGIILLHSCKSAPENRHLVSVSILPQKYFVERIAGDYVQVNVMVPPGMNPATCDLSTAQLKKLYDSDLCFAIGCLPFETAHLFPVLEKRKDIRLVNHSEGIPLLSGTCSHAHHNGSHSHAGTDPHIWLSPKIAARMAATVFHTLAGQYPAEEETFRHNYNALAREIDSIAMRADKALADKQGRTFLIYHPALTYFAADYGLRQISIEEDGKEPNPAHLRGIIDLAREEGIRLVFIQNQFDINNAQAVAREIGGEAIAIDPLAENWTQEMTRLIDILKTKL